MEKITVGKTEYSDIESIALTEKECFSSPWSETSLREALDNPHHRFFTARLDGEIIGYIGAYNVLGEVSVTNIAVKKEYRKRGAGSMLLEKLITSSADEGADFITLEVRPSNESAVNLYTKYGFLKAGLRRDFYSAPKEDALLMTKRLK